MKALITYVIILFSLTACGGGDSSGSPSAPTPAKNNVTTLDLQVPYGYDYNPMSHHQLELDLSKKTMQRAFLSVYQNYQTLNDGSIEADFQSLIVSAPMNDGRASISYSLPNYQKNLLLEVWFYDGSAPLRKIISVEETDWIL